MSACGGPPPHKQLMVAVKAGDANKIDSLLEKKVDIGFADEKGKTCLHYGARSAPRDVFSRIVENASVDEILRGDRNGRTPLMTACNFGNVGNVRVMMDRIGPDKVADAIAECDNSFCNALHFSAGGGHSDVVFMLIEETRRSGGDLPELVASCDGGMNTALHKACIAGNPESVRLLLEAGADASLKNCDNMTCWDCCSSSGSGQSEECRTLLDGYGNSTVGKK
eukprot:g4972.t1